MKETKLDVLVLEDDLLICELLEVALNGCDANIHWAHSCKDALIKVENTQFDLCILDIGLPDGDGISFARHLRETGAQNSDVPIIYLTGFVRKSSVIESYGTEALDYITKPFSVVEVGMKLKNLTEFISAR